MIIFDNYHEGDALLEVVETIGDLKSPLTGFEPLLRDTLIEPHERH